MRWKELVKSHQPPVQPDVPESVPLYLRECQSFQTGNTQVDNKGNNSSGAAVEEEASHMGGEQMVFLNLTAKVCLRYIVRCGTVLFLQPV